MGLTAGRLSIGVQGTRGHAQWGHVVESIQSRYGSFEGEH